MRQVNRVGKVGRRVGYHQTYLTHLTYQTHLTHLTYLAHQTYPTYQADQTYQAYLTYQSCLASWSAPCPFIDSRSPRRSSWP